MLAGHLHSKQPVLYVPLCRVLGFRLVRRAHSNSYVIRPALARLDVARSIEVWHGPFQATAV